MRKLQKYFLRVYEVLLTLINHNNNNGDCIVCKKQNKANKWRHLMRILIYNIYNQFIIKSIIFNNFNAKLFVSCSNFDAFKYCFTSFFIFFYI